MKHIFSNYLAYTLKNCKLSLHVCKQYLSLHNRLQFDPLIFEPKNPYYENGTIFQQLEYIGSTMDAVFDGKKGIFYTF